MPTAPIAAVLANTLSPFAPSPCVPSSYSAKVAEPPTELRSTVTDSPLLAGLVPGVTVTLSSVLAPAATELGAADLAETLGAVLLPPLHGAAAVAELRAAATAAEKSAALLSVSVQPLPARKSAFAVLGAGALFAVLGDAVGSEQFAVVPKPTKSMIAALAGQAPLSAVVLLTRAILPAVALMAMEPVTSGVGRLLTPLGPLPSAISK